MNFCWYCIGEASSTYNTIIAAQITFVFTPAQVQSGDVFMLSDVGDGGARFRITFDEFLVLLMLLSCKRCTRAALVQVLLGTGQCRFCSLECGVVGGED